MPATLSAQTTWSSQTHLMKVRSDSAASDLHNTWRVRIANIEFHELGDCTVLFECMKLVIKMWIWDRRDTVPLNLGSQVMQRRGPCPVIPHLAHAEHNGSCTVCILLSVSYKPLTNSQTQNIWHKVTATTTNSLVTLPTWRWCATSKVISPTFNLDGTCSSGSKNSTPLQLYDTTN
jgi:hypothetical protein